jgi:hypothetical protein
METITITREWHQPQITTTLDNKAISLSIPLADYLLALSEELGSPAFMITKGGLLAKMQAASDVVVSKVKAESVKVV